MKIVFIDTMIWLEIAKGNIDRQKFEEYLTKNSFVPIIHILLEIELFQSQNNSDFEKLWSLIEGRHFVGMTPVVLPEFEIYEIYEKGRISQNMILSQAHGKPQQKDLVLHKKEVFKFAHLNKKRDVINEGQEEFNKASLLRFDELEQLRIFEMINLITQKNELLYPEVNSIIVLANTLAEKDKKFSKKKKTRLVELFNEMKQSYSKEKLISEFIKFKNYYQLETEEFLKLSMDDFSKGISHYLHLTNAFRESNYLVEQWRDYIEIFKATPFENYKGWYVSEIISDQIRKSDAKAKLSDQIDFFNLRFLPYLDLYVTDAHICTEVRKNFPDKYNVQSFKEFRNSINE